MGARFSAPFRTGPGAHPASWTMVTGSFLGVKSGRGVTLTHHPLLMPWSRKSRAIPLLLLRPVRPVQSLRACTRVHFFYMHGWRKLSPWCWFRLWWRLVRMLVNKTMDSWAQVWRHKSGHMCTGRVRSVCCCQLTEQKRFARQVEDSNVRQLDVTQFAYASTSPSNENTTGVYL